jgi:succinate dehydrogenase hydrophobic anchor subunit
MSARPAPRVGFNLDYFMWLFTRLSGLFLILFGFIGLVGALMMEARIYFKSGNFVDIGTLARWTFFPITTHVTSTGVEPLVWGGVWWQIMQYLTLIFGAAHGINGVRQVIEDYIGGSWLRTIIRGLLFIFWLIIMIVGWNLIVDNIPV